MPQGEEDVALNRAAEQMELLREVEQWLPDFRATFTAHDVPYQFLGHGMKWEAAEHASMSECECFRTISKTFLVFNSFHRFGPSPSFRERFAGVVACLFGDIRSTSTGTSLHVR